MCGSPVEGDIFHTNMFVVSEIVVPDSRCACACVYIIYGIKIPPEYFPFRMYFILQFSNSEVHDPEELHEVCWMQLLHDGEDCFNSSRFKSILTNEGKSITTDFLTVIT